MFTKGSDELQTIIRVKCVDQKMQIVEEPVVASGGKNEDLVHFDLCPMWDGFQLTAVFYREANSAKSIVPYYSLVDAENMCVVPHEVTKDAGTIYFGVFGVLGEVTRTSEVVKYKIKNGAVTELLVPSEPSPDIWEQLIDMYRLTLISVDQSNRDQQAFIKTAEDKINEANSLVNQMKEMMGGEVNRAVTFQPDGSILVEYVDGRTEITTESSNGNVLETKYYFKGTLTETRTIITDSNGNLEITFVKEE